MRAPQISKTRGCNTNGEKTGHLYKESRISVLELDTLSHDIILSIEKYLLGRFFMLSFKDISPLHVVLTASVARVEISTLPGKGQIHQGYIPLPTDPV